MPINQKSLHPFNRTDPRQKTAGKKRHIAKSRLSRKHHPMESLLPPFDARRTALEVLNAVYRETLPLDSLLDAHFSQRNEIDRKDINLSHHIIFGVLRWQIKIDWVISLFSKKPVSKIDLHVLNILRMGVFQLLFLDRIPHSAAVHTSVALSKSLNAPWICGFINGILRNVIRESQRIVLPDPSLFPVKALSIEKSFPEWLTRQWVDRFGTEKAESIMNGINTPPPITLRVNPLRIERECLMESLEPFASNIQKGLFSPEALRIDGLKTSINRLPFYESGGFQIQDEAAQLISHLMNPKEGDLVLDACAGLGTKTAHMAQLMKNKGTIIAMDIKECKIEKLQQEMDRMGVSIVRGAIWDIANPLPDHVPSLFDRILLDAPCSGLGVSRRNPDAKYRKKQSDPLKFGNRQLELLDNLSKYAKVHGRLVYTVCSFQPEETDQVIISFLKKHPEFAIEKKESHPLFLYSFISENGYFETFPGEHHMDGFFSVVLKRLY